jgi:Putative porin
MRQLWQLILVFHLALTLAVASPPPDGDSATKRAVPVSETAARSEAAHGDTADTTEELSNLQLEIEQLRQLLDGQARELQEQRERLQQQQEAVDLLSERLTALNSGRDTATTPTTSALAAKSAGPMPSPTVSSTGTVAASSPGPQGSPAQDDIGRRIEERVARIGPFTFSGDFRLRDEPFFGGSSTQAQVRHRGRMRARLYLNTRLNDEISGGLAIASGHLDDSLSTNQDLNRFYSRKPFDLDRAFITYTPRWFRQLSLTGGKFAVPWYRTELTWDNDINPEGVADTLNFALPNTPLLKRLAVVSFVLPFAETTGVNFNFRPGDNNRSMRQSVVYGGQLQSEWQLASWLKLSAYTAFYNWHNADPVALSVSAVNPSSPNGGTVRLGGFNLQNSVTVWTQSTTVPASAGGTTNVNAAILNAQFGSKFGLLDTIARFDIKTASAKWPVVLLADFVQNTKACANAGNFLVPTPAAGATVTATTNTPCNSRDRQAYWLEGRLGRAAEQGDWQFAYTRMFIEREAVLGAFNFSDLRQNSAVSQHRVEVFYNFYRNVQLGFTGLFGRPLRSSPPAETVLKRLQFDVLYRF